MILDWDCLTRLREWESVVIGLGRGSEWPGERDGLGVLRSYDSCKISKGTSLPTNASCVKLLNVLLWTLDCAGFHRNIRGIMIHAPESEAALRARQLTFGRHKAPQAIPFACLTNKITITCSSQSPAISLLSTPDPTINLPYHTLPLPQPPTAKCSAPSSRPSPSHSSTSSASPASYPHHATSSAASSTPSPSHSRTFVCETGRLNLSTYKRSRCCSLRVGC